MTVKKKINYSHGKDKVKTVLLCGQTGAGKTAAGAEFIPALKPKIGYGSEPCTKGINYFKGKTVNIYDSEGYEIGKQAHYRKLVINGFIKGRQPQGKINGVWYIISGAGKRATDYDFELIKEISSAGYKVAVLISKIDEMSSAQLSDLKREVSKRNLPCFVLSNNTEIKGNKDITDWQKLLEWTNALPEVVRRKSTYTDDENERYILEADLAEKKIVGDKDETLQQLKEYWDSKLKTKKNITAGGTKEKHLMI